MNSLTHNKPAFSISSRNILVAIIITIGVGAFLRFAALGSKPFWMDEAASWQYGTLDWSTFWSGMWRSDLDMIFYYLILHFWLNLGSGEWVVRTLSVIFGLGTIPLIYILGNRLFDSSVGLISAALLAVNGFHIDWSQQARGYSLVVFLIVLSTYFFLRILAEPDKKKYWIVYVIVSVLACYTQLFAVLVLASQWLSVGLIHLRRIRLSRIMLVAGAFAILLLPMIIFLINAHNKINWIQRPTVWNILYFATVLVGDRGYRLLFAYGLVCCLPLLSLFIKKDRFDFSSIIDLDKNQEIRLVIIWVFFPIFAAIFVSYFIQPVLEPRYLLICVPPLALLAAYSIVWMTKIFARSLIPAYFSFALLLLLSTAGLNDFHKVIPQENYQRSLTQYILKTQSPGDGAFFILAPEYLPFKYYAYLVQEKQPDPTLPDIVFPSVEGRPTVVSILPTKEQIKNSIANRHRIWLVSNLQWWFTDNQDNVNEVSLIRSVLEEEQFTLQESKQFDQDGAPAKLVELYVKGK